MSRLARIFPLSELRHHEGISADVNDLADRIIDRLDSRRLEPFEVPAPAGRLGKLAARAAGRPGLSRRPSGTGGPRIGVGLAIGGTNHLSIP